MEIWDIYDKDRNKTGRTHERGKHLDSNDYHIVVHVWIVNSNGQILIQKRQTFKNGWPGMWDCSAAGSAIVGDDSLMAAVRETKEELGIDLNTENAKIIHTHLHKSAFDDNWLINQDVPIESLNLQNEEVADAKWADKDEIRKMISDGLFVDYMYYYDILDMI